MRREIDNGLPPDRFPIMSFPDTGDLKYGFNPAAPQGSRLTDDTGKSALRMFPEVILPTLGMAAIGQNPSGGKKNEVDKDPCQPSGAVVRERFAFHHSEPYENQPKSREKPGKRQCCSGYPGKDNSGYEGNNNP